MDTFLNIRIMGFSLRFVFIPILLLIFISITVLLKNRNKFPIKFLGLLPALIWVIFLIAFIPNTSILVRNIAYMIWLIIYFAFIPCIAMFIESEYQLIKLIKYYLQSFFYVAVFCVLQFVLGLIKVDLLVQQWWTNGIPRASGFSYEPSYLATYMLLGWVVCFYLLVSKSRYSSYMNAGRNIMFISLAIILSGSRMGIMFIMAIPSLYILYSARNLFTKFHLSKIAVRYFVILSLFVSSSIVYFTYNFNQAIVYLNGLGLFGTVSHSYVVRTTDQKATYQAFKNSPIIGYSLGGLPTQIALIKGKIITTQIEAKDYEGLNIFAEVLAASGIFGFIFFAYYFFLLFKKNISMSRLVKSFNPEFSKIAVALMLAFFCELLILIFNQNILRAYLWIHIAILNCIFFVMVKMISEHVNRVIKLDSF